MLATPYLPESVPRTKVLPFCLSWLAVLLVFAVVVFVVLCFSVVAQTARLSLT